MLLGSIVDSVQFSFDIDEHGKVPGEPETFV